MVRFLEVLNDLLRLLETNRVPESHHDALRRKWSGVATIGFLNAHAVNLAYRDVDFRRSLSNLDYLLRDGVGIELAMKVKGIPPGKNHNGTDYIPKFLRTCHGSRLVMLGSTDDILTDARHLIEKTCLVRVVGVLNGFDYTSAEYLDFIKAHKPDVILLAMGMPKQEKLAAQIKQNFECCENMSFVVVCGGAILSFITNNEKRAPMLVRKIRLEWLWRLYRDPIRLWRRYILGGLTFCFVVLTSRRIRFSNTQNGKNKE